MSDWEAVQSEQVHLKPHFCWRMLCRSAWVRPNSESVGLVVVSLVQVGGNRKWARWLTADGDLLPFVDITECHDGI